MAPNNVIVLAGLCTKEVADPPIVFNYSCDEFQKHAFYCISQGENLLVTAHTGSGKTTIAEYAIAHTIRRGKTVVYTSPIKSLSNEKYNDFHKRFADRPEINLGILTGDNKINPDGNCLIMTAEILRNALYKLRAAIPRQDRDIPDDFIDKIGCVVMDEVHFINDPDRGKVWEETLVLLDRDVQLVLLSATISQPEEFAGWIGRIKQKPMNLIPTAHRAVPLQHYLYAGDNLHLIFDKNSVYKTDGYIAAKCDYDDAQKFRKHHKAANFTLVQNMVQYLQRHGMLQAIFFSFSKKNCELYAQAVTQSLVDHTEMAQIDALFHKYMHKYESQYAHLEQYQTVKRLLSNGIAYHHSGLLPILKELTEIVFHAGLVKVLFATETFAVGVNMPTKTVVFTELEKHCAEGKRVLNTAEYRQMSGRAGRRGIDTSGNVIILPIYGFPENACLRGLLTGAVPNVCSKFQIDYQFYLKAVQSEATNVWSFLDNSLYLVECGRLIAANQAELEQLDARLALFDTDKFARAKEYHDLVNAGASASAYFGVKVTMPKAAAKKMAALKAEFATPTMGELYRNYCEYIAVADRREKTAQDLDGWQHHADRILESIKKLLTHKLFIVVGDAVTILKRGAIAAQINECNAIIMTEMITGGLFEDLDAAEIVGLLAIFVDEGGSGDKISRNAVKGTPGLHKNMAKVESVIAEYQTLEQQYGIVGNENYWSISFDFVDAAYRWACGEMAPLDGLYIGNFIRNIIKLNNISKDLKYLFEIDGNNRVIPVLEKIEPLLMRDFVTINSLYLLS